MVLTVFTIRAESRYTYDAPKDLFLGTFALGVFVPPFFVSGSNSKAVTADAGTVNPFDRSLMFAYNKPLDIAGDVGMYGLAVLPVISLIGNIANINAVASYAIMYGEAFSLTYGTVEIIKDATSRNRPYTYFGGIPAGMEEDYYNSFPSRHTALAFMSAGFLSSTFVTEYPDSPLKIPVVVISNALAVGVGVSRIASGNHFLTDVLVGGAIGSLYGYLIPFLHLRKQDAARFALSPMANGFMLTWKR
jgi:membrane-associated phospholipid phosphatase